ncbi:RNA polymerase sigma factor [Fuerstiella marisgermanici]|uniref:RNA polymerase sigma factor n=1 Tax=Fuerstiella marisgermanici TaxID=1891926 RepID=A0A1P8WP22_9PLAN|nr:sigma factor [Fuerstiella marisgermanici]APZ95801.1 RNA polymerase sigma factor [Fuerstiella marisgermanici]
MPDEQRISRIETLWSVVRTAQGDDSMDSRTAMQQMLDRYGTAIRRYLLGATRDEDLADELFQEFALRFLTGKYSSADAERGRFRSFLKTILFRLVAEHHRKKGRDKAVAMGSQFPEVADDAATGESDDGEFNRLWSDELLKKSWAALQKLEERTGRPLFTVMQVKVENPTLRSPEIAELVSERTGKELSTGNARVILHRAREQFAELLVDEVEQSLDTTDVDRIREELTDLNLLSYCKPALERRTS